MTARSSVRLAGRAPAGRDVDVCRPWATAPSAAIAFLVDIDGTLLARDRPAPEPGSPSLFGPDRPRTSSPVWTQGAWDLLVTLGRLGPTALFCDDDPVTSHAPSVHGKPADGTKRMIFVPWDPLRIDRLIRLLPARHYVAIDDDPAALVLIKGTLRARVTTVHVAPAGGTWPPTLDGPSPADLSVGSLAGVLDLELARMRGYLS